MQKSAASSMAKAAVRQLVSGLFIIAAFAILTQARTIDSNAAESVVIPSPNQNFNDGADEFYAGDIQRTSSPGQTRPTVNFPMASVEPQELASNEASVPVYVSPFERTERSAVDAALNPARANYDDHQESSHAPPNYAPRPAASATDLKTSASYGHHHGHHGHHGYGYGHGGWLDMGAWTGGKGSFGWYADYPVGSKHHGYGRR